jgi:hypothetical protein
LMTKALSPSRFARVLAAVAVVAFALSILTIAVPKTVSASEPFNLYVYGTVEDSLGEIVVGATVILKDVTASKQYGPFTTDEFGQWDYFIPDADWTTGDTIRVEATYGSTNGYGEDVAPDHTFPMLGIDVTLSDAIPEFGTTIGAGIAACLAGAVAIVAIGKPRKK